MVIEAKSIRPHGDATDNLWMSDGAPEFPMARQVAGVKAAIDREVND